MYHNPFSTSNVPLLDVPIDSQHVYTKHLTKILILKCVEIIEKISYERNDYESVEDVSLS